MSAVCQYSLRDVQTAFDGPYMELQESKWSEYTGKVPEPRPGSVRCNSSKWSYKLSPSSMIVILNQ